MNDIDFRNTKNTNLLADFSTVLLCSDKSQAQKYINNLYADMRTKYPIMFEHFENAVINDIDKKLSLYNDDSFITKTEFVQCINGIFTIFAMTINSLAASQNDEKVGKNGN